MHTRKTLQPCSARVTRASSPAALTMAASLSVGAFSPAMAGPTGGVIVEGQGSISTPNATTTVIDQSSHQLNLNWSTFNVAANENVQFVQPSSKAVAFNRILDQNPSQIFGRIDANGQVVLVNPNGLLIGRTAQLNVNSLVASSLDAIDFDAASGRYRFSTSRTEAGAVTNDGTITAGPGGSITLLGGRVSNAGSILADYGTVNLAAGRAATIDLAGDGLLRLEVGSDLLANGSGSASAVENSGAIQANGGRVLLTASAMDGVFTNLINNTGVVRANRIDNTGGVISLVGPEGMVISSGTLDASSGDAVSTGGSVSVLGDRVGLMGNAVVDVSGATGGGTALIGGDYQGLKPDVLNASRTYVSAGSTLNADAGTQGDGGRIIVWANDSTRYEGSLSATGGSLWGNGGFAEVSGKHSLSFAGTASLKAPHGVWGTILLDPSDITISTSATTATQLQNNYDDTKDGSSSVTINNGDLTNLLDSGNVILQATHSITQQAGANVDSSGSAPANGSALTLETTGATAGSDITLNAAIATNNADVTIHSTHGAISMSGSSSIDAGNGKVTLLAANDIALGSITTLGQVDVTSTAGALSDGTGNRVTADTLNLTTSAAGAAGAIGTSGNPIDISVNHLNASQAGNGGVYVSELNAVILDNLSSAGIIDVSNASGNITANDVEGAGGVHLDSAAAIVDGGAGTGISSSAGTVSLDAVTRIGTVTSIPSRTGSAVRVPAASSLAASISGSNGQINLLVPSGVTVSAGGISVGSGAASILIQSTGALDASHFAPNAINIGSASSAGVALGTNGLLTLNSAGALTNVPASTLLLHGIDIRDNDGSPNQVSVAARNLVLELTAPAVDKTFDTSVQQLDASFGTNHALTVNQTGGTLKLGAISAGGGDVQITATGLAINDDDDNSTVVSGATVTLNAAQLGSAGHELDTNATALALTSSAGTYVREANDVDLTASATTGVLDVATLNGAMNVLSASGLGVQLATAGTAPRNLTLKGLVSGNGGNVTLTAGSTGSGGSVLVNSAGPATITANLLTVTGDAIGQLGGGGPLQTNATAIHSTSTNGGTFITEANDLSLTADATNGAVNVQTTLGAMDVTSATGVGVTLAAVGSGKNLTLGAIDGGSGAVALTAGGAILAGTGNLVSGASITANGTAIGTLGTKLNTSASTLNATSSAGGIYVEQGSALGLTASATGGDVDVDTTAGALTVSSATGSNVTLAATGTNANLNLNGGVSAGPSGDVTLTAAGAIGGNGSNHVTGHKLTATGASIGSSGTRLATTVDLLDTTSTAGGTFITESDVVDLTASATGGAVNVITTGGNRHVSAGRNRAVEIDASTIACGRESHKASATIHCTVQ